jgi:PAS domain S-box-containing protein
LKTMNRSRIGQAILLITAGFSLVAVTLLMIDKHVIQPAFQTLERQHALEENEQVVAGISNKRVGFVDRLRTDIEKNPLTLSQTPAHADITTLGRRTGRLLSIVLSSIALVLLICLATYRYRMKTSQANLEESEARYRQLFELESDALFLIDNQTGQILEANNAAVSMYGYYHEELLSRRNFDLSAEPEATQKVTHGAPIIVDQVVTIPLRFHRKKDGTVFPVEITGRFFVDKGRPVHIAAIRDITARKQVEDQLKFTQFAVDHCADGAFWVNNEGRIIYANQEGCRSLGYTKEELEGMTIPDIDTEFPIGFWSSHWQELKIKQNILLEGTHKTKDGRAYPVEIRANFVAFDGHEYNCAFVRDITSRKKMEQERAALETLNWQLQKEESLGRMAGAIAHHFNNQLMSIMGFLHFAMDKQQANGSSRTDEDLTNAMAATERAARLSSLMLTYLGKTIQLRQPMDLGEVCQQYIPMLKAIVPVNTVLETNFQSPGPVVLLNVEQIQQILTNLVTNSVEAFSDDHTGWIEISGWISLDVKTVKSDDIPTAHRFPVGWHPQDEAYARLAVTDNGGGITHENIEKLFDPFFTSKFTGRGLGLSVALGLTKVHGGGITVGSEPERGSVFQIFLPLHKG